MFYSHDILQRRGGKFGVIWIAATKGVSLTKRDYVSVNVSKTCNDILMYIDRQPAGGSKVPRLSLYLSSQLMFGVTRVYQKQYEYLIVEVRDLHRRFSASKLSSRVFQGMPVADIELPRRVPRAVDACTLPEPSLEEYNSDFGVLRAEGGALEPFLLPTIEMFSLSPSRLYEPISSASPERTPKRKRIEAELPQAIRSPHTVSSADEISFKEDVTLMISPRAQDIAIPGEQELPPVSDIQFEQMLQEAPAEGVMEALGDQQQEEQAITSPLRDDQVWQVDEKTGEVLLSPVRPKRRKPGTKREPRTRKEMEATVPDREGDISPLALDQGAGMEGILSSDQGAIDEMPAIERPEMRTPTAPAVIPILRLAPLDEAETPSPARRHGRKRRLVFADEVLKLSKDDIRNNMATAGDLMVPEEERYAVPATHIQESLKEMFEMPARKVLKANPTFMRLWSKQAVRYVPSEESYSDEEMRPVWSTEYLREKMPRETSTESPTSEEKSPELSSIQQPRQAPEDTSTEFLRGPDISADLSAAGRAHPFDDTPSSLKLSDISHLSEEKSRGSVSTSGLRRPRRQHDIVEDIILEEDKELADKQVIMDMGQVLLEDAGLMAEEVIPAQDKEPGFDDLHEMMEKQRQSWETKSPEHSTSEEETAREGALPQEHVFKEIRELFEDVDYITFEDLVPPTTYRLVAAKIFSICLEYGGMQKIKMHQEVSYGTIFIERGKMFDEM